VLTSLKMFVMNYVLVTCQKLFLNLGWSDIWFNEKLQRAPWSIQKRKKCIQLLPSRALGLHKPRNISIYCISSLSAHLRFREHHPWSTDIMRADTKLKITSRTVSDNEIAKMLFLRLFLSYTVYGRSLAMGY
jgi:hypothetical protein